MFRTFFGGDTSDWASPTDQHTYFRNIELWGGYSPSNMTGVPVSSGADNIPLNHWLWLVFVTTVASACLGGLLIP